MDYPRFHFAFPVIDLEETRIFYRDILGCSEGRSSEKWIDFNFFGHQISAHLKPEEIIQSQTNVVDGCNVPVRHAGVILDWNEWKKLRNSLKEKNVNFIIEPQIRFEGNEGEQATMFFLDPSGNALEIKGFKDESQIFAT